MLREIQNLREQIELDLDRRAWAGAYGKLQELWHRQPTAAAAAYVLACGERLRPHLNLQAYRVAILRSWTVEPALPLLRAGAFLEGLDAAIQAGGFNTYTQEILDQGSPLYAFSPDAAVLCVQTRDLAPELWDGFAGMGGEEARRVLRRTVEDLRCWFATFRRHSGANLIVHTFERPSAPSQGILDHQSADGQIALIAELNRALREAAGQFENIYLLDYDGLVSRHGREHWHDPVKWLTARMPVSAGCLPHLAKEWLRHLQALTGKTKALVVDLDNTLWGGVAGEDGFEGVRLGPDYAGAAYLGLQRAILDVHQRGIILAISSKNNPSDALRILQDHPGMLLRAKHFAAMRINWNDKAQSLREMAAELNIGTDALAFLDDNPVERERIRAEMPEVKVIELPENAIGFEQALRGSSVFERLAITPEDRERNQHYRERRQRTELRQTVGSLEQFYWSLDQKVDIAPLRRESLARIAQLTQKTNQFNLTTKRYNSEQIRDLAACPGCRIYSAQVRDRFGDNGIVGVVITRTSEDACEIDTLVLSCRVIGRTVETALLAFVAQEACRQNLRCLRGWFVPTEKNAPAADFYRAHAFRENGSLQDATRWILDLRESSVTCPEWIELHVEQEQFLETYAAC